MDEKYNGGCQYRPVNYEAAVDPDEAFTHNCSRCQPLGVVLGFAQRNKFTLHSGTTNLTEYLFNKKEIAHLFCQICGIQCISFLTYA